MITTVSHLIEIASGQKILYPCEENNLIGIQNWCKEYNRFNKFPTTPINRFLIGVYQIHQGMDWKDNGLNKYESYCASFLHFVMLAEMLELDIAEPELPITFNLNKIPKLYFESFVKSILKCISICAKQLIYSSNTNKTKRKSRYDKEKLRHNLMLLSWFMIGIVPCEYRMEGIYVASEIMIGLL